MFEAREPPYEEEAFMVGSDPLHLVSVKIEESRLWNLFEERV